jgi:Zn-dependent M16 (insulinase) family peptidase
VQVLAYVMSNGYLHREIREKGGAYGGGARQSRDGVLACYSYRDPNTLATIEHFHGAIKWATEGAFTGEV